MTGNKTDTGTSYPELIVCEGDGGLSKPLFFEAPMMIDPTLAYATLLPKTSPVASPFTHSKSQGPTMAKGQTLPATTPPISSSPTTLSSLYSATIVPCCSSKAPTQSLGTHIFPGFGTECPRSQISHPQGLLPCCFWVSAQISPW